MAKGTGHKDSGTASRQKSPGHNAPGFFIFNALPLLYRALTRNFAPMNNAEFIVQHRAEDVRRLAFQRPPEGVDLPFCLRQIEGWQTARTKLPHWANVEGIIFPPRLSMEQSSSQETALYKADIIRRLLPTDEQRVSLTDLTGGFGVDFSYLAPLFHEAHYVERQEVLCQAARHNLPLLGLSKAEIHEAEATDILPSFLHQSLLYLDPARRDDAGRKVVALADCTPDVEALHDQLIAMADVVMLKLSPMLDIHQTLRLLPSVREVHVVSVENECKELLLVLHAKVETTSDITYHCVNLGRHTQKSTISSSETRELNLAKQPLAYLYEPNVSLLKAGMQDVLCQRLGVQKLHPFSHLFTSQEFISDFPGRSFQVEAFSAFGKKEVGRLLSGLRQANLTVRNFPSSVQDLRRRLKLAEGGDTYLFATTLADGMHVLIKSTKI